MKNIAIGLLLGAFLFGGPPATAEEKQPTDIQIRAAWENLQNAKKLMAESRTPFAAHYFQAEASEAHQVWSKLLDKRRGNKPQKIDEDVEKYIASIDRVTHYEDLLLVATTEAAAQYFIEKAKEAQMAIRGYANK